MGGATEGAAFAVSVLAAGVLAGGLCCDVAIGESVGVVLVDVLLDVGTGSLRIGAAGALDELVTVDSGVTVALLVLAVGVVFVATFVSDLDELFVFRLDSGAGAGIGVASATLAGASRGVVAVVVEVSAAAEVLGAASASAVLFCATGVGALTSLSLTLWSNTSAPPMTVAVMIPKASPKWFIVVPIEH